MESFKKEILIALFFGALVGLSAVFLLTGTYKKLPFLESKIFKTSEKTITATLLSPTPQTQNTQLENLLTINSPLNEEVFATSSASIKGVTNKDSNILIITENEEKIIRSGSDGKFFLEIKLNLGSNQIRVENLSNKEESFKEFVVFYFEG